MRCLNEVPISPLAPPKLSRSPAARLARLRTVVRPLLCRAVWCLAVVGCLFWAGAVQAAVDAEEYEPLVQAAAHGKYEEVIDATRQKIDDGVYGEDWVLLKAQCELTLGRYADAQQTLEQGLSNAAWSIRLRWPLMTAVRFNGDAARAHRLLGEIRDLAGRASWRYADAENLVVIGRAALADGLDPRQVLEACFDRARKLDRENRSAQLATIELAISKDDQAVAADAIESLLKELPEDADLRELEARCWQSLDSSRASVAAQRGLELNPRHLGLLLWRAEQAMDREAWAEAIALLDEVRAINAAEPRAWALRSALCALMADEAGAKSHREEALRLWNANPEVDYLIGRQLSRHYRFQEGLEAQRQALQFAPDHVGVRAQMANDLLRLGRDDDGWKLVESTSQRDPYNVQLHNLARLRTELDKYRTLRTDRFVVRMTSPEAITYGEDVLALLTAADAHLGEKYGYHPPEPIVVEIYADPDDFAVRTFGLPSIPGFLGVCFGKVITANSPAGTAVPPTTWRSVLWHEYCHVITLGKTRHRLPRWLSEGISVYEERLAHPGWGQQMSPQFRERILTTQLASVRELGRQFSTGDGAETMFAYYQSSLVVECLVTSFGERALNAVLTDLAAGLTMDDALERNCASIGTIDGLVAEFARQRAQSYAPGLNWEKAEISALAEGEDREALANWVKDNPTHYVGLDQLAKQQMLRQQLDGAEQTLKQLANLYPEQIGPDSAAARLAEIYRLRNRPDDERRELRGLFERSPDDLATGLRLLEIDLAAEDWPAAAETADRLHSLQPMLPTVQRGRALAAEHLGNQAVAQAALHSLLAIQPDDPADLHYRLARLAELRGDRQSSREHVLAALEIAPRYREAQQLLLRLHGTPTAAAEARP